MATVHELGDIFTKGFGVKPRAHQISAVNELLGLLRWGSRPTRALIQHAPGAGKTEAILLLVFCALQERLIDRVIILNSAVDLEDQFLRRTSLFLHALKKQIQIRRAGSSHELKEILSGDGIVFSLLQKFQSCPLQLIDSNACRSLVVIDEAHRGIPEEGTFIQNVDLAFGRASKVLFTATPKHDTLRRYGTLRCDAAAEGDLLFHAPFHTYTQRDAILSGAILNPLDRYISAVPEVAIDGTRLIDTAIASIPEFVERLHMRRGSPGLRSAWAKHILSQMQRIDDDMEEMVRQGHQCKKLVVLGDMQEVFDMTVEMRRQAKQRGLKNAFGKRLRIGCFFSGRVDGARNDQEANSCEFDSFDDASVLEVADVIVVCQKYTSGWDEWRVVAIFILRRLGSAELLQQLLGRATRTRPGSGKRNPWIFDYLNDPDWIFSAMARFYEESRAYQGVAESELWDLKYQIERFFPDPNLPWKECALELPSSDRALLRAAVVRYLVTSGVHRTGPLDCSSLRQLLRALNLTMKDQLFGDSSMLAERAANALSYSRNSVTQAINGTLRQHTKGDGIEGALQVLRKALGVRARARACGKTASAKQELSDTLTPAKRALPGTLSSRQRETPSKQARAIEIAQTSAVPADSLSDSLEHKRPVMDLVIQVAGCSDEESLEGKQWDAEIKEVLNKSVETLAKSFEYSLQQSASPGQWCEDDRHLYVSDLRFAAMPLEQSDARHRDVVQAAARDLQQRLDDIFSAFLRPWLEAEAQRQELKFRQEAQNRKDDFAADLVTAKERYAHCVEKLGGHAGRKFKASFARNLQRIVDSRLNNDRQELMRQRVSHRQDFERRAQTILANIRKDASVQPTNCDPLEDALQEVLGKFSVVADKLGGRQANCFKDSFESGIRRYASQSQRSLKVSVDI